MKGATWAVAGCLALAAIGAARTQAQVPVAPALIVPNPPPVPASAPPQTTEQTTERPPSEAPKKGMDASALDNGGEPSPAAAEPETGWGDSPAEPGWQTPGV